MSEIVEILKIGHEGDGIAEIKGEAVYVPFTLAGEKVRIERNGNKGALLEIIEAAPNRVEPICKYFTKCGGCKFQHMPQALIREWKSEKIENAFKANGINPPTFAREGVTHDGGVSSVTNAFAGGRRRAKFNAKRDGQLQFGFMEASSNEIVEIESCPILAPSLSASIPKIRELVRKLTQGKENIGVQVTLSDTGLDIDLSGFKAIGKFNRGELENLARACQTAQIARLTINGEEAFMNNAPILKLGNAIVNLPANAFLQATKDCETQISDTIMVWLGKAKRAIDLFSGVGTFSFRLKEKCETTAYEMNQEAIFALNCAAKSLAGGHTLKGFSRDLFRVPVSPLEMKNIDVIVLDPARAGAEAQCKQIVRAKVAKVIYVSCEPTSFARDAKILIDGGYRFKKYSAFDQFQFSTHVELVGLFER